MPFTVASFADKKRRGEKITVITAYDALVAAMVHAAGIDNSLWPSALAAVAKTVGALAATFEVFDKVVGAHREFYASR